MDPIAQEGLRIVPANEASWDDLHRPAGGQGRPWRQPTTSDEGAAVALCSACWPNPDLPAELAEQLARELPGLLAERLVDLVCRQVRVLCERFDLDDEDRLLQVAQDSRAREG